MRYLLFLLAFWAFYAAPVSGQSEGTKLLTLHGTIGLSGGIFRQDRYAGIQPGSFWSLTGNPVVGIYGHPVPVSLIVSSQQRTLTGPFSQIGISPTIKWIKFHAGVRNLTFSPFSIAGHSFLGGGVEINPGIFRFGLLGGRFEKAREADTTSLFHLRPAFRRLGYGIKIGIGRSRSYLDLIYFRAKDDSVSIRAASRKAGGITPDENAVLGVSSRIGFGRSLYLQLEGGASLYTRNIGAGLWTEGAGDARFRGVAGRFSKFFPVHTSTSLTFAGEAGLHFQAKAFQMGLTYRRVEPEYSSMGAWFFQTDIQQVSVSPSLSFRQGKVRVQLNTGWQGDNLLRLKPVTSSRLIFGGNLSVNTSERFGFELQANNFQVSQENRYPNADSLRLQQSSLYLQASPHWTYLSGGVVRSITSSLLYQKSNDFNPYTRQDLRSDFVFAQAVWTRQVQKTGGTLGLGFNARINKNGTAADDQALGLTVQAGRGFWERKVQIQGNINYNIVLARQKKPGNMIGGGLGLSWSLVKSLRFSNHFYFLSSAVAQRNYHYWSLSSGLEYNF